MANDNSNGANRFVTAKSVLGGCGIPCGTGGTFPRPCAAPPRFCACPGPQGVPGPRGLQGETGPAGPTAATIPFSLASGIFGESLGFSAYEDGTPAVVQFAGFGASGSYIQTRFLPGDWERGVLDVRYDSPFPATFILPYTGTLKNLQVIYANRTDLFFDEAMTIRPFVCLALSDGATLSFTVLPETITFVEPYVGVPDDIIPKYSLRRGSIDGLNLVLAEGSFLGILGGIMVDSATLDMEIQVMLSFSGGLYFR